MSTKQLKQKILSLAIAGRLVPQDPADEPASELLKRINPKAKLLETEQPLPEGWCACQLKDMVSITTGDKDANHGKGNGQYDFFTCARTPIKSDTYSFEGESLILPGNGDIGLITHYNGRFEAYQRTYVLQALSANVYLRYLYWHMSANWRAYNKDRLYGTAIPYIRLGNLATYPVYLPPLAEQKRITEEVERWSAKIDQLEHDFEALSKFGKQVRKKLLAAAIAGHLVSQDPKDEPASEFLHRINPRATLIQGNVPFDVPGNWAWCRLGNICDIARGGSPRPIKKYLTGAENGVNWIKIGDTKPDDKYVRSVKQKIKPEGVSRSRFVHKGDFLLTNSMSFGRPYILDVDGCIHDGWLVISPKGGVYDKDFLYYLLSSPFAYEQFSRKAGGGVVDNLNSEKVSNTVFPLPPLAEQKRIVEKLESMFAVLDSLDKIVA